MVAERCVLLLEISHPTLKCLEKRVEKVSTVPQIDPLQLKFYRN